MDIHDQDQAECFWLHFEALMRDEVPHKAATFVRHYGDLRFNATATNDAQVDSLLAQDTRQSSRHSSSTPFFTAVNLDKDGLSVALSNSQHTIISISSSTSAPNPPDELQSQSSSDNILAQNSRQTNSLHPSNRSAGLTFASSQSKHEHSSLRAKPQVIPENSKDCSSPSSEKTTSKTPQPLKFSMCGSLGASLPASLHSPVGTPGAKSPSVAKGVAKKSPVTIATSVSGDPGKGESAVARIEPLTRELEAYPAWMLSLVGRELSGTKTLLFVVGPEEVRQRLMEEQGLERRVQFVLKRAVEYLEACESLPKFGPVQKLYFKISREKVKEAQVCSRGWLGVHEDALENVRKALVATLEAAEVIPCVQRLLESQLIEPLMVPERTDVQRQQYLKELVKWRIVRSLALLYGFQSMFSSSETVKRFELRFTRDFSEEETAFTIVQALVDSQDDMSLSYQQKVGLKCWQLNKESVASQTLKSFILCSSWCLATDLKDLHSWLVELPAFKRARSISVCGDLAQGPRNTLNILVWIPPSIFPTIEDWVQELQKEKLVYSACTTSKAQEVAGVVLIVQFHDRYIPVEVVICLREDAEVYRIINSFYSPKKKEVDNWCKILKRKAPHTPKDLAQYVTALQKHRS